VRNKLPDNLSDPATRYVLINGASAYRSDDRLSNYHENDRRIMGFCKYLERNKLEEIRLFHKFEKQIAGWAGHEDWYCWRNFHISEKDAIELDLLVDELFDE
jgi:hypothetical protein